MADLDVSLVAMDRLLWQGKARIVVATTVAGDIGILPGHEPVLALLGTDTVRIEAADGQTVRAAVHRGFFSVAEDRVAILAETAELDTEIDVERARRALDRIRADGSGDRIEKDAELRARARLKAAIGVEHQSMLPGA
jgi:F-type H+-transporting ATPase subunit epsilon